MKTTIIKPGEIVTISMYDDLSNSYITTQWTNDWPDEFCISEVEIHKIVDPISQPKGEE